MYLSNNEMKQLKKDLMTSTNQRNTTYTTFNPSINTSSDIAPLVRREVKSYINNTIGPIFETNIRNTLEVEFNWEKTNYPRHFFFRKIYFDERSFFLTYFSPLKFGNIIIRMDCENNNCYFINETNNKIIKEIREKLFDDFVVIEYDCFLIGPPQEIEIDGLFRNFDFNSLPFKKEEIEILFDNSKFIKYDIIVIEIKLSVSSLGALIEQLKRDQIMGSILGKPTIYIGFLNISKGEEGEIRLLDFPKICGSLECIIFGIKNGIFSGRNILYDTDWKLISQFYALRKEVSDIKKELSGIKNEIKEEFKKLKDELIILIRKEINSNRINSDEETETKNNIMK